MPKYIPEEEIAAYFLNSDILVLPYLSASGSGIASISRNYELPVIATRVGDFPDLVSNHQTGLLISPGSIQKDTFLGALQGLHGRRGAFTDCEGRCEGGVKFGVHFPRQAAWRADDPINFIWAAHQFVHKAVLSVELLELARLRGEFLRGGCQRVLVSAFLLRFLVFLQPCAAPAGAEGRAHALLVWEGG